jgi:gamma-glutamyl hydrolase
VIVPGGGTNIKNTTGNKGRQTAQLLYNLALESNDRGDPFPIHGTCLGFQLLTLLTAQNDSVICHHCFNTEGTPLPLNLTDAARASKLFAEMPASLLSALVNEKITENSHSNGIEPEQYDENTRLHGFYNVLSTNQLPHGRRFVSTIEAKQYPITATQWHPEKNNFEWGAIGQLGERAIPHSAHAVALSQYMANDFVARARLSSHRFVPAGSEAPSLIYNHPPQKDPQGYFSQIYLWERGSAHLPSRSVVV